MPASSLSIAALLLLLYLTASTVCSNFIPTPRQNITELPGYGPPPTAWSSGYLQADPINGGYLYYIMVESQSASPENDPVVLWLNGGPGCSSLFALFAENGPLLLNESLSLIPNPYSWNKHANVLYLDQPVGTGFSYLQNNISGYATTDAEVAAGAYRALLDFFTNAFPLLASNAFYITGESFAGRYIPAIAATIAKADFVIRLTQAEQLVSQQQFSEALEILNPLREERSNHPKLLQLLAQSLSALQQWKALLQLIPRLRKTEEVDLDELNQLELLAENHLLTQSADKGAKVHYRNSGSYSPDGNVTSPSWSTTMPPC